MNKEAPIEDLISNAVTESTERAIGREELQCQAGETKQGAKNEQRGKSFRNECC